MTGRKRHIIVDTIGLLLAVVVHPADIQDRDGAKLVINKLLGRFPRLRLIWADAGYAGQLVDWVMSVSGWALEIVRRPRDSHQFEVLPRRWVVERTFAWLGRCRRLSKDYEELPGDHRGVDLQCHDETDAEAVSTRPHFLDTLLEEIRRALTELPQARTPNRHDWGRLSQTWRSSLDSRIAELEALRDRLSGCIGCGCLSLENCGIFNRGDRAAGAGAGAHYLFSEAPDPDPEHSS